MPLPSSSSYPELIDIEAASTIRRMVFGGLTSYDASYVALAEQLDVPLLTCDAKLGRANGHRAEIVVYLRS